MTTEKTYQALIRNIQNYPSQGIIFRDITPFLADSKAFLYALDQLKEAFESTKPTKIIGIEARGFIFASALSVMMNAGFVPVRKPDKLPSQVFEVSYELEYGKNQLQIHQDALSPGDRVLIVDDVIATGGTIFATLDLLKCFSGIEVLGVGALLGLTYLEGLQKLSEHDDLNKLFYLYQY